MIRRVLLGLLASALIAGPTAAANWVVDKAQSRLGFKGVVEGDVFDGSFRKWDARISFDPKALATSKVLVTIDTGSAYTGDADRDGSLPTPEWFDPKRFPTATFAANRIVDLGGGRYQAIGELTVKGIKKPLVLPFTLAIIGDVAKMQASLVLNRTAFGIGSGKWNSDELVGTKVTVVGNLTARRGH